MPIGHGQNEAGEDDTRRGPQRRHGAHDAHVGSELLAWGNLEGDVHADGDEHARAQCLDDAPDEQHGKVLRERSDDRADDQKRRRGAEERAGGKRAVGEG